MRTIGCVGKDARMWKTRVTMFCSITVGQRRAKDRLVHVRHRVFGEFSTLYRYHLSLSIEERFFFLYVAYYVFGKNCRKVY